MAKSNNQQLSKIELDLALNRLLNNDDFRKVFVDFWLGEYKNSLASELFSETVASQYRAGIVEKLAGIANFEVYFFGKSEEPSQLSKEADIERNPPSDDTNSTEVAGGF